MERRLAAILAADVVGYSRLMGEDEAGTLERLKSLRRELVQPKIAEGRGRIVKLMGDGLLAEFPSVVEAVRCAVDIQQDMAGQEAGLPDERRIRLRIGVNLGDIIVEGSDIYGDGVNVAARLEGLAEPGGICISGKVYEEVRNKLRTAFEDLGEQEVKNIPEPVRVYRWTDAAADPMPGTEGALPLPDKPSIAVLPFTNMSGDPDQEYFSDGITEDIITELSRFRSLFVIARNSSFTYKGEAVKIKQVAEELGVRFVLEGSVQRSGDTVRVTAQLIDAVRGFHVWTKRYDRELTNLFALQDEISEQIATALEVKLTEGEQARLRRKSTSKPEAYRLYLEGKANFRLFTRSDMKRAENLFEQALAVDPKFVAAIVELAHVHYVYGRVPWSDDPTASFRKAEALVRQALAIDANYPEAFTSLGRIERSWRRDFEKALTYHRKAVALSPNCAECLRELANELQYIGDGASAIPIFKQAMRLEPNYSILYLAGLGQSYNLTGEHPKAVQAFKEMIKRWPNSHWGYLNIAITYGMMGQTDDARRYVKEALQRRASLRASLYVKYTPYKDRARAEREAAILRKAGMPD